MPRPVRQTKIVFTIGPATSQDDVLQRLIEQGVDVCRFNMAHADHVWLRDAVQRVHECCRRVGRRIALMMDVKGPEIRTRDVPEPVPLREGDLVEFSYHPSKEWTAVPRRTDAEALRVAVNYRDFVGHLKVGGAVLIDGGLIRLVTEEIDGDAAVCRVVMPGVLGSRQHVNLPGTHIRLNTLTEKDLDDVRIGVEEGFDSFALSFVHEADDVFTLRSHLTDRGSDAQIIAKIENAAAVSNLEDILAASDGLMIARGDLGIETPFEELPIVQRRAVEACLRVGKPAIVATQMLESMIQSPMPTRAEITDVSNAVRERADCVMLSGETTVGRYPTACVDVMNRIIMSTQRDLPGVRNEYLKLRTPKEKMVRAAVDLAEQLPGAAIVVFTRSGDLARLLSAQRPTTPIFAFTDVEPVFNRLLMLWGVEPFLLALEDDPEQTVLNAFQALKQGRWMRDGDQTVVVTNVLGREERQIDTLQVRGIE